MYDTIIIGAGMSGLAAGIRLAYYDQRVCVLERHYTIGGLNSFYRLRGRDYDVGLHALTNFTPKGTKTGPLARLLRQLRLRWDDFAIAPQLGSEIAFPSVRLRFDNDEDTLRGEVARAFPHQADNFDRLAREIVQYDDLSDTHANQSARQIVGSIISEPLLVEMLFCPLLFYGSAREHDMDWGQFSIMFRSIFLEGLGRPAAGVRLILKHLVRKFRAMGGELRLRSGVKRLAIEDGRVTRVVLDDDEELECRRVVSSAGWCETMRLCDDGQPVLTSQAAGQLSFCETIATLDVTPGDLGHHQTVTFYNDHDQFVWARPDGFCDVRSGVICSPNNFAYEEPLSDGTIRVTALANFDRWRSLDEEAYRLEKLRWYDRITESAVRFVPDYRGRVIDTDMFTPTTIVRFTGHDNGAVYGAPEKHFDGRTHLENLFICGSDQGFVGVIGAITSGIGMANRHCLKAD
ncbi:MAG: NAD(P)/FAD-dependent oxidoreductase [Pirellulales bacterium]